MENKKEELKKLENQYNKYMKIVKFILLIVLFVVLIFATRFIYLFSISNKIIHANYVDIMDKNVKKTYSFSSTDHPEENSNCIYYYKDGINVMEASFFKTYTIDNKIYNLYSTTDKKTYSIREYNSNDKWEDFNFFKKIIIIAAQASSYFDKNISYEELNGEKCIVFKDEYNKAYYNAENFLEVRTENTSSNSITDIKYEFDVVTDEDITLPNLSEYLLEED